MRLIIFALIAVLLCSCGDDVVYDEHPEFTCDTVLSLTEIPSGTNVDTGLSSIRISAVYCKSNQMTSVCVERSGEPFTDTVNIYADSSLSAWMVDSIAREFCTGNDLRLIGTANGQEVAVPFHWMDRFVRTNDTIDFPPFYYHPMLLRPDEIELYPDDSAYNERMAYTSLGNYFGKFYGDAFDPLDPTGFPDRKPWRQTIAVLATEGQNWDMVQMGVAPDTAAQLAAYNEFVNKLEIYDKAGEFNRMPKALIDISYYPTLKWSRLLLVLSEHYKVQKSLRDAARTYLADKIANEGKPAKEFTDEDLLLLYPDRLRWGLWMSGPTDHYYDAFHLRIHRVAPAPEVDTY